MDSLTLLIILFAVAFLGFIGIVLSLRKAARVKRFARRHRDAVWVFYRGPNDSKVTFGAFESGVGMSFDFSPDKRGIIVLPGEIRLTITFSREAPDGFAFTQTLQFTALRDKSYILEADEAHRVMRVYIG